MENKIVLATVNAKKDLYSTTADEFSAIPPNVNMGLLYSYIKSKNIPVEMIESDVEKISIDELINLIEKEEPLVFGIICTGANPSSSTMSMTGVIDFFHKYNKRKIKKTKSFIWGPHPTILPERTLRETGTDFVIRGEGYETIVDLFNALNCIPEAESRRRSKPKAIESRRGFSLVEAEPWDGKIENIPGLSYLVETNGETEYVQTKDAELIKDLDILPMIDWKIMNPSKYRAHNWHCFGDIKNRTPYAILWTSFGCPFRCAYCCINNLFGKRIQRFRSIDSVIKEISILVEKYNVKHLKILDELFVVNSKRIEEFCDKLEIKGYDLNMWSYSRVDTINRHLLKRLKKVGMNWISYGFETATTEMLKTIKKGCNSNVDEVIRMTQDEGVYICADVMAGLPDDDCDSMNRTYDFLVKYNFEWVNIYPMFGYPGTEFYKDIEGDNVWKTYALYGYECMPRGTKYLSPKEVLGFRDEIFIKYHSRNEYLSMIEEKFGVDTKEHLIRMINIPLKRKLLEED